MLEDATNQGHSALSRYRRYGGKQDLEHAIARFERALNICPLDHPCRAVAQSNLGMVKLILCQVEDKDASLDIPLCLYCCALAARPVGHIDRPSTLIQLAAVLLAQFVKSRDVYEEAQAVELLSEARNSSSAESHENRAARFMLQLHAGRKVDGQLSMRGALVSRLMDKDLRIFSAQLLDRFKRYGDISDLQQAIPMLDGLAKSTPVWDVRYLAVLVDLSLALRYRFDCFGELSDLEDAISRQRVAADLAPYGHPDRLACLTNLANSFVTRFTRLGELSDLQSAISTHRNVVDLTPQGDPEKHLSLSNLGNSLFSRFQYLSQLSDLEDAILMHRDAVGLAPHGHPAMPINLNNLASCLRARFKRFGELNDLEEAISRLGDAVNLIPCDHPHKSIFLASLGSAISTRSECLGELNGFDEAISRHRDAIYLTPRGHPDMANRLDSLGNSFLARFQCVGELSDLEDAVSTYRNAVDLTPQDHPNKPGHLRNLGTSFKVHFDRLGELSDLEKAISMLGDAAHLTPHDHPDKHLCLNNLGTSFKARFRRLGERSDLEKAILTLQNAAQLTPCGHPNLPASLNNLANSFKARFDLLGEPSDLEDAISMLRRAAELASNGFPDKACLLTNLGNSLRSRFESLGDANDLEEAIARYRVAVDLTSCGHHHKLVSLYNLGNSLRVRFEHLGEPSDLEDAISTFRNAIDLLPQSYSDRSMLLGSLAGSLVSRTVFFGEQSNIEEAISLYSQIATAFLYPVSDRFHASQIWIWCALHARHHSLLEAYSVAISILPQLAWVGLSLNHRYSELTRAADVVREAAAAALDLGLPEIAVEWLEQGRSIVWGELFQLRSSHEELLTTHPGHARRLQELSAALEHASSSREKSLSALWEQAESAVHRSMDLSEQEADNQRMLAIERDKLLREIRGLPGFEWFLLHKEFSQLRASAHTGPVVILNAAESRCDALIILPNVDHIIHVPLSNFNFKRSAGLQKMVETLLGHTRVACCDDEREGKSATRAGISWESLLSMLWNEVVKPVLDAMAFSVRRVMPVEFSQTFICVPEQSLDDLSRIFWCPTGPFMFLPIHAAGLYGAQHSQPGHKVSDFAISSYVPTLSILAPSSNLSTGTAPGSDLRILTVRQPPTDGQSRLPGVNIELEHIKAVINNSPSASTTLLESSVGTVEEVLGLMKQADWVHFACHGIQNGLNSGLCLADQRRLKLRDIIALSRPRGGLAFLSACQTAMGEEHLTDEAIHIAAGMLFAGYGGVVGTMWSISDKFAPEVARDVYEQLFRNGTRPDYREAARALHEAIGRLRDSGKASFATWLPFIHVGL